LVLVVDIEISGRYVGKTEDREINSLLLSAHSRYMARDVRYETRSDSISRHYSLTVTVSL